VFLNVLVYRLLDKDASDEAPEPKSLSLAAISTGTSGNSQGTRGQSQSVLVQGSHAKEASQA